MKLSNKFDNVADYAWLAKGRKYWNLWIGNPFCISLYRFPLSIGREDLVSSIQKDQKRNAKWFIEKFPDTKWQPLPNPPSK